MIETAIAMSPSLPRGSITSFHDWSPTIDRLLEIRNLEDDWDGEGTEAPSQTLVDFAISLARSNQAQGLPSPDRVHASVNATVYFEWQTPAAYCEIEVLSPVDAESRTVLKGSNRTDVLRLSRRV